MSVRRDVGLSGARLGRLFFLAVLSSIAAFSVADAQFETDFESATIEASDVGTTLTGQDGYYIPTAAGGEDWLAHLYEGNALEFPANPDGGDQFVAGVGPPAGGVYGARAQRDVTYGSGSGVWTIEFDFACKYTGTLPAADFCGSVSTQDYPGDQSFIGLVISYSDLASATTFDAWVGHYNAAGATLTEEIPDPDFTSLSTDTWFRWKARFDLDTNLILDFTLTNIEGGDSYTYTPDEWYLGGGSAGGTPPGAFRLFAGSPGSAFAVDNVRISGDCNLNGVDDEVDIADGTSEDCNANGTPDECDAASVLSSESLGAGDAGDGDLFGATVAMDGDTLVIGAPGDDEVATDAGAAYIYTFDGSGWVESRKLLPDIGEAEAEDEFGYAVAISGDVIVVGARLDDTATSNTGSVYVFRLVGGSWTQEDILTSSFTTVGDQLGTSVDVDGDVIVAGAPLDDAIATNSGAVAVWRWDGDSFEEDAAIYSSDIASLDQFGRSVAVSGYWLVIGAPNDDDDGTSSGAAYFYVYDGTEWGGEEKVTGSDNSSADLFGAAVSIDGNAALIGAAEDDGDGIDRGAAYLFRRTGGAWVEEQKLVAADGSDDDSFGYATSIDGDYAAIGAYHDDIEAGSVYLFACEGNVWEQQARLVGAGASTEDELGTAVTISGPNIAGGAPNDESGTAIDTGTVYIYGSPDCNGNDVPDSCEIAADATLDDNDNGILDSCEGGMVTCSGDDVGEPPPVGGTDPEFKRGDCDGNGNVSALADGLFLLRFGFAQGTIPPCRKAADVDGNNSVSALSDTLFLLRFGFSGGNDPPAPGPDTCGVDGSADSDTCEVEAAVCDD